mgnify:FL=1
MSIFKRCVSLLPVISIAVATTATAKPAETQCVDVHIPAFNLIPEVLLQGPECSISSSKLVRSKAPDQVFLYDIGVPAVDSCFVIFDYVEGDLSVDGVIINQGQQLLISVSGEAGLTLNAYPDNGVGPGGALSFTAVSLLSLVTADGTELGQLVTRDAGTILADGSAAARLSLVKGQGIFSGATGYVDEFGQEFDPSNPAAASGRLCGKGLADSLFPDS